MQYRTESSLDKFYKEMSNIFDTAGKPWRNKAVSKDLI